MGQFFVFWVILVGGATESRTSLLLNASEMRRLVTTLRERHTVSWASVLDTQTGGQDLVKKDFEACYTRLVEG